MPTQLKENEDGTHEIVVTRVEQKETLHPHQVVAKHLTLKRHHDNLQKEMDHTREQLGATTPAMIKIAREQVALREAEIARHEGADGGERLPVPKALSDDRDWWERFHADLGGDAAEIARAKTHARRHHAHEDYTHKDKMTTPR